MECILFQFKYDTVKLAYNEPPQNQNYSAFIIVCYAHAIRPSKQSAYMSGTLIWAQQLLYECMCVNCNLGAELSLPYISVFIIGKLYCID